MGSQFPPQTSEVTGTQHTTGKQRMGRPAFFCICKMLTLECELIDNIIEIDQHGLQIGPGRFELKSLLKSIIHNGLQQ